MSDHPLSSLVQPVSLPKLRDDLPALVDHPQPSVVTPPASRIETRFPFQRFINERAKFNNMLNTKTDIHSSILQQISDAKDRGIPERVIWEQNAARFATSAPRVCGGDPPIRLDLPHALSCSPRMRG